MKRMTCGLLIAAMLTTGASAYQVPHLNEKDNIIVPYEINCDPQAQAEMLQKLGLYRGTDEGLALGKTMTRAEAAVMICDLLGGAEEAAKGGFSHPYTDVPAWAGNAVGWLYQNKATYGISAKKFGSSQTVTAELFASFLSRAICGGEDFKDLIVKEDELAALAGQPFLRSHAVAMMMCALDIYGGADNSRILDRLVERGCFTTEQFADAAWGVIQPHFQGENAAMAYIPYAQCSLGQLDEVREIAGADGRLAGLSYFYAYREANGQLELYRLDWRTLDSTLAGRVPLSGMSGDVSYIGQVGGRDYLAFCRSRDTNWYYSLYSTDGTSLRRELAEEVVGNEEPSCVEGAEGTGGIVLSVKKGACRIDESGVTLTRYPSQAENNKTLYAGETAYVIQTVTEQQTTVACIDRKTGQVLKSYTVPQDYEHDGRTIEYQTDRGAYRMLYGEAGLYQFDPKTGELVQLMDNAVQDMIVEGETAVYLTHANGKRIFGMERLGGDRIVQINHATGEQKTLVDDSAGIPIAGFQHSETPSVSRIAFYTAAAVGMMHYDQCFYLYDAETGKITVTDYTAGRPEVWITDWDHPEDYKISFIEEEQARLDAAWNSKNGGGSK